VLRMLFRKPEDVEELGASCPLPHPVAARAEQSRNKPRYRRRFLLTTRLYLRPEPLTTLLLTRHRGERLRSLIPEGEREARAHPLRNPA
jgi:hypothetical protein